MATSPLYRTHFTILFLALVFLLSCLVQPSQSMPGSSLDSLDNLIPRDPTPLTPGVTSSRTGSASRNSRCQTQSGCDENDDNEEEEVDSETEAPEYEPSDFSDAPEKESKVVEAETDAKAKDSPSADAPNVCIAKDRCSGECCDKAEHCVHMALRLKKSKQLRLKWRTCCPKKQVAGHNGHCCLPEKLVQGACQP